MSWAGYDHNLSGIADGEGVAWDDSEQALVPVTLGSGNDVSVEDSGTEVTAAVTVLDFGDGLDVTDNGGGDVTIDATATGSAALIAVKDADETVNNSATLQDDDDLSVSVSANTDYIVTGFIIHQSASNADIKFDFSAPSGTTWSFSGVLSSAGSNFTQLANLHTDVSGSLVIPCDGTTEIWLMNALVRVGGTAGTFTIQWAQGTAQSSDTDVLADSWIKLEAV